MRVVILKSRQSDDLQQFTGSEKGRCGVFPLTLQSEQDVAEHRSPGKQRRLLEHHGSVATRSFNRPPIQKQLPFAGDDYPGHHIEKGRFTTAARSNDADKLVLIDGEINLGKCTHRFTESSLEVVNADSGGLQLGCLSHINLPVLPVEIESDRLGLVRILE